MYNIAVCDDEPIFCEIAGELCRKHFADVKESCNIFSFHNGSDLLNSKRDLDIVFLDIDMPKLNGFDTAKLITDRSPHTIIIFLTSHSEMMQKAFYVSTHRFLLKPVNEAELFEALRTAADKIRSSRLILVDNHEYCKKLHLSDILFLESLGDGCAIHTQKQCYTSRHPLKYYASALSGNSFLQINKSFVISLEHVSYYNNDTLLMDNSDTINISRRSKKAFVDAFHSFVKKNAVQNAQNI